MAIWETTLYYRHHLPPWEHQTQGVAIHPKIIKIIEIIKMIKIIEITKIIKIIIISLSKTSNWWNDHSS